VRDVAQNKLDQVESLVPHPLELLCLPEEEKMLPSLEHVHSEALTTLLDIYMDDFIGLVQAITMKELTHFTHAVLHRIHTVFPLPGLVDDQEDEPISVKKLKQGDGRWDTQKEILGWLFNGITKCLQLPVDKVSKLWTSLLQMTKQKSMRIGELEKLNGKLMHATIGIPNGRGLLSPLIVSIAKKGSSCNYKERQIRLDEATKQALQDLSTLLEPATNTLC